MRSSSAANRSLSSVCRIEVSHGVSRPANGFAAPQAEGLREQLGGRLVRLRRPGQRDQPAEPVEVDRLRVDGQQVAARLALDPHLRGVGDGPPQPGQVAVERAGGPLRGVLAPHPVDQLVDRDRTARLDEQHAQHAPLPGMTEVDGPAVYPGLHRAEHPELRRHPTSATSTDVPPGIPHRTRGFKIPTRSDYESPTLRSRSNGRRLMSLQGRQVALARLYANGGIGTWSRKSGRDGRPSHLRRVADLLTMQDERQILTYPSGSIPAALFDARWHGEDR